MKRVDTTGIDKERRLHSVNIFQRGDDWGIIEVQMRSFYSQSGLHIWTTLRHYLVTIENKFWTFKFNIA